MKRVSLKDIAEATGLSKTTVSFILNGKGEANNISKETIAKVKQAALRLDYRPNSLAKSLVSGRSDMIGLIVPRITDTFFAQIATEVEREAARHGYTVIYGNSEERPEREQRLIDTFVDRQVDGLIIAPSMRNEEGIRALHGRGFPYVLIDRCYPAVDSSFVTVDNEDASRRMVEELLARGYRRIALVTVSPHLPVMESRAEGYRKALAAGGLGCCESLLKIVEQDDMDGSMARIVDELRDDADGADAIYFTTHYLASLGFKHLRNRGVAIPGDMAVCCFGDSPYLELFEPPVSAIPMPAREMGTEAIRILMAKMADGAVREERIVLPLSIVSRGSW